MEDEFQRNTDRYCAEQTVQEEGVTQLLDFLTHTKGNILDILLAHCPDKIVNMLNVRRLRKRNHVMILIEKKWKDIVEYTKTDQIQPEKDEV